ncbi:beta-arabinofuranosyltransferase RAY1 isoform X1 [Tanacetum coccineum]|uniref:Beta-arabinofuranosyltransferase RAY1 isoform X1 n=1 Tax=Tanacetum coccineum TaxID=301880 RepID=A0ABQ5E9G6_9ASTR
MPNSTINEQIRTLTSSEGPTVTIFAAATPFSGSVGSRQSLAIRSWLGLSQNIRVVLFSQDPSVFSFAASFDPGSRVSVEPDIDFTFLGTPFFHSMVARAQASNSDISVLMDSETILLPDFISTLSYVHKLDHDWLLVASSRNVSHFPFHLDVDGKRWLGDNGERIKMKKDFLSHERWDRCDDKKMIMAWNNGDLPLHNGVLPPFLYGKGFHTLWVVNEALSSDFRFVFDASWTISSFFISNPDDGDAMEARNWENVGNFHLKAFYGSLSICEAGYYNVIKLFECNGHYHFGSATENIVYPLGSHKGKHKKLLSCFDKIKSLEVNLDCSKDKHLTSLEPLSLPFSLEVLLSTRADQNKTVVLAVAGYSYKDMLMSWVCRLHLLHVSNFVVCALDDEIYDFCVLQGLPVFRDRLAPSNISYDDCHFGTNCFQRVTKVKSRIVLQILKLGYNLLMSDVDVYWFKNPLPLLNTFGPTVFVAQSDEYKITGPINMPRRLNSGFYYARSDNSTIAALEKVVKHASTSNLSEQPSFYDTLCGLNGSYRVGDDMCLEPETNLTVRFLDRNLFPNGAYRDLWDSSNVSSTCMDMGCFVLHNNWISGRQKKLERQFLEMFNGCLDSLFGVRSLDNKESRNRNEVKDASLSIGSSLNSKEFCVRVVHAGGKEDLYRNPIVVSQLMKRYPGMCFAWPEVFKNPYESVLSATDILFPGQKYLLLPVTTLKKLKKRHSARKNKSAGKQVTDESDDSVFSANDYYVSKEKWTRGLVKKHIQSNRKLVPPVVLKSKLKSGRGSDWEPSLTSIQELSP